MSDTTVCPRCGTSLPLGMLQEPPMLGALSICARCGAVLATSEGTWRAFSAGEIQMLPDGVRAGVLGAMVAVVGQRRPR